MAITVGVRVRAVRVVVVWVAARRVLATVGGSRRDLDRLDRLLVLINDAKIRRP